MQCQAVPYLTDRSCKRRSGLPDALPVTWRRRGTSVLIASLPEVLASSQEASLKAAYCHFVHHASDRLVVLLDWLSPTS